MDFSARTAVLILMFTGIGFLLIGTVMTTIWRRDDARGETLFWAGSDAAARPERYIKPQRVLVVR